MKAITAINNKTAWFNRQLIFYTRTGCCLLFQLPLFAVVFAQDLEGVATHFEALGSPYGGCGVPTHLVESEHFVALNVFNQPNQNGSGDYTRPLKGDDLQFIGEFNNGHNCGRWVRVIMDDDCVGGSHDGNLGSTGCQGQWTQDSYNGAELYMVVTDACGDNNHWCREIPYHLDLHTSSLNQFTLNDGPVVEMYPGHFNNRKIRWEYVPAPNYSGDINLFFMQGSQQWWVSLLVTNLPNGIHGIEQLINGQWVALEMNSDMGQAYILKDLTPPYRIRIYDAQDQLLFGGREYQFDNPCLSSTCQDAATQVAYSKTDCQGVMGGSAYLDSCGTCADGQTGITAINDPADCIITSIKSDPEKQLRIFPNPGVGEVSVRINDIAPPGQLVLFDVHGRVVRSNQQTINREAITFNDLSPGIYTVRWREINQLLVVQ